MAYLFGVAFAKRLAWQDALAARIVRQARQVAEYGSVDWWTYLYGDYSGRDYTPSWQATTVYLLERGRRYPELERMVLLLEARRTPKGWRPWGHCFNWDMRTVLAKRSLKHYPDDMLVAWAAGRVYYIGGDYERAAEQFRRVLDSGLDVSKIGDEIPDMLLSRYLACLTMLCRDDEAEQFVASRAQSAPRDAAKRFTWLDFLCRRGKYAQMRQLVAVAKRDFPGDMRFDALLKRSAWWGGDLPEYRRLLLAERGVGANAADLPFADARLALIDGDFATADRLLQFPSTWTYKAYAEAYAMSRNPKIMQRLLAEHERLKPKTPPDETADDDPYAGGYYYHYYENEEPDAAVCGQILRGYAMARQWQAAVRFEAKLPRQRYASISSARDVAWVLSTVALGGRLLLQDLGGLRESGGVVSLVRSDYFADALRAGGRDRGETVAWLRMLVRPDRWTYDDIGNGTFTEE